MNIPQNFLGKKYILNDFLMLNIESVENVLFDQYSINGVIHNRHENLNIFINENVQRQFQFGSTTPTLNLNRLAYKCKLWLSTKQLKTRFTLLIIQNENGEQLFSELVDLGIATPSQVFNFNNKLYTSYVEIYLPKEAFDSSPNSYAILSNVIPNDNKIITVDQQYNRDIVDYFDLNFESIVNGPTLNEFIDFNLSINSLNFVSIEPFILNQSQSLESYINNLYNGLGVSSGVNIEYICTFINSIGTTEIIKISNDIDKYGKIKFAIDATELAPTINELPLQVFVVMQIKIDNLLLQREKTIMLTHRVRKANEVVNNLDVSNLVTKEIVEKIEIINQSIVSTPASNDLDSSKEILRLNNPVFGNTISTNKLLSDFEKSNLFTFSELTTFNLNPGSKIYFKLNNEIIIGNYTSNKVIFFNIDDLLIKPKVGDKFIIELLTNNNGENKIQTIINGVII